MNREMCDKYCGTPLPTLKEEVERLLDCRNFNWDVLLEGRWSGCAQKKLKELTERFGPEKVLDTFKK